MKKKELKYSIGDTFYMLEDEPNLVLMKAGLQQPIYKCKVKCIGTTKEWRKAPYSFGNNYKCGYTNEEHMYRTLKEAKKAYWKRLDGKLTALTQEYNKQYGIILDEMLFIFNYEPPDNEIKSKTRSKK